MRIKTETGVAIIIIVATIVASVVLLESKKVSDDLSNFTTSSINLQKTVNTNTPRQVP